MTDQRASFPKAHLKKLLIYAISVFVLNTFLLIIEPTGSATDLRGQAVSGVALKLSAIIGLTIGISVISSILALVVALIPYMNLLYGQKYLAALLLSFSLFQLITLLFEIRHFS